MQPRISTTNDVMAQPRKVFINPNFQNHLGHAATQYASLQLSQQLHALQQQQAQWGMPNTATATAATTTSTATAYVMNPQAASTIHINPQFLQRKLLEQNVMQKYALETEIVKPATVQKLPAATVQKLPTISAAITPIQKLPPKNQAKIISKSSKRIVRVPQTINKITQPASVSLVHQQPLISINKRKLVRSSAAVITPPVIVKKTLAAAAPTVTKLIPKTATVRRAGTKYKIDRRDPKKVVQAAQQSSPLIKLRRRRTFVARYALRRVTEHVINKKLTAKSISFAASKLKLSKQNANKSLQLLNINGVLYKSSRNKLQRKMSASSLSKPTGSNVKATNIIPKTTSVSGRTLFVRGTKFVMDAKGFKLTRLPAHNAVTQKKTIATSSGQQQRIDIGGLTYVASAKSQNVFVRTTNHISRAHLVSAKQRSMQLLNKPLVKTNVPCPIFRRLGKCMANLRGKCRKLHDKRQVIICQSFLRGECNKKDCLLSHNISLSKMPVCKFYLQGVCVRDDCPYLHKKLSQKAEICVDFLRGYCASAEKCNKRHEFLCPEYVRNGKCTITNCMACQQMQRDLKQPQRFIRKSMQTNAKTASTATATKTATTAVAAAVAAADTALKLKQKNRKISMQPTATTKSAQNEDNNIHARYFDQFKVHTVIDDAANAAATAADTDTADTSTVPATIVDEVSCSDSSDIHETIVDENETLPECNKTILSRRPKLGKLPSFIPLS